MIKTLRLSFSLKNTYRVNSILYSIRQIPLLGKFIPGTVYQIQGFKVFANILSIIWEIISAFMGKILYFLIMVVGAASLYELPVASKSRVVLHILLILSLIGAALNSYLFSPTKDKYYAMILVGMNAREYTLINYSYCITCRDLWTSADSYHDTGEDVSYPNVFVCRNGNFLHS